MKTFPMVEDLWSKQEACAVCNAEFKIQKREIITKTGKLELLFLTT